jgi:hypothetical protein
MTLARIYSFRQFVPERRLWVEVRRSPFLDPNWHSEARQQDGLVVASRTLTPAEVERAWQRHGASCEVTYQD